MHTSDLLDKIKKDWDQETSDLAIKYLKDDISFQEFYQTKKELDFRYYDRLHQIIPNRNVVKVLKEKGFKNSFI
ncbi:hypothetical protein [Flexithrix dorotheae]|uniref:hypothetical protein n=1 Tax=Flexithrix dorotheae TaxID=70993 RepID=UPI0003725AD7|nr:hypothetical protein [Flexithrix dorotheae]